MKNDRKNGEKMQIGMSQGTDNWSGPTLTSWALRPLGVGEGETAMIIFGDEN
jgi:hypothetical protein